MEHIKKSKKDVVGSDKMLSDCLEAMSVVRKVALEKKWVAQCLVDLDAYSSTTFDHSINVAVMLYNEMSRLGKYSSEYVEEWVAAALTHDVGKLATPLHILHSQKMTLNNEEFNVMMEHSVASIKSAKTRGFSDIATFAAVGHHINASSLDLPNFEYAATSRFSWASSFPNGKVEDILNSLENIDMVDREALKMLTFVDAVEAQRSPNRSYKEAMPWNGPDDFSDIPIKDKKKSVFVCISEDVKNNKMPMWTMEYVDSKDFRARTDFVPKANISQRIRESLCEIMDNLKIPELSADKLKEMQKNPNIGAEFIPYIFKTKETEYTDNSKVENVRVSTVKNILGSEGLTLPRDREGGMDEYVGEYVVVRLFNPPEFDVHRSDLGFKASVLSLAREDGNIETYLAVKLPAIINTKSAIGIATKDQVIDFLKSVAAVEVSELPREMNIEKRSDSYVVTTTPAKKNNLTYPQEVGLFKEDEEQDEGQEIN